MPLIDLTTKEKALIVAVKLDTERDSWKVEDLLLELRELVSSSGVDIIDEVTVRIDKPTANLYIGKGKVYEIMDKLTQNNANVVIFSEDLSGTQQRNLEEILERKTIDRTQLILEIFSQHAKTNEGKFQVELAQLQYILPRLTGKGIMLSRLGGGIGTRGPGEQKLEIDRRRIEKRISLLRNELRNLSVHRETMRKKRVEKGIPLVSLVGYTNAGKSTLLNSLTQAGQIVRDSLFTTLDPLSRILKLPNSQQIVLSDTVGFLHKLPHHLIEAFKATLEEVVKSDLLIHVLDTSHHMMSAHKDSVYEVLKQLGVEEKPMITALNKIDKLEDKTWASALKQDFKNSVLISAKNKENLEGLFEIITSLLSDLFKPVTIKLPINRMDLVNKIYKDGRVEEIKYTDSSIVVKAYLPEKTVKEIHKEI